MAPRSSVRLLAFLIFVVTTRTGSGQITTCGEGFCLNEGECNTAEYGYPACICLDGFGGFYCETAVPNTRCIPSTCLNGGACPPQGPPHPQVCECPIEYDTGYYCEKRACTSNADCNRGTCQINGVNGPNRCVSCPEGLSGPLCEHAFGTFCGMKTGLCLNGGSCAPRPNSQPGFVCMCPLGFGGQYCQVNRNCSDTNPCHNKGVCENQRCQCVDDFTGILCEKACSASVSCLNGGVCTNGICSCPDGLTGPRCGNQAQCSAVFQCRNGGTCSSRGVCICPSGYSGPRCGLREPPACTGNNDCMHGGICNEEGICECVDNFEGSICEIVCTTQGQCRNGGTCNNDGMCQCEEGFTGPRCGNAPASSTVVIVVAVVAVVVVLILVVILIVLIRICLRKRKYKKTGSGSELEMGHPNRRSNNYVESPPTSPPAVMQRPTSGNAADVTPDEKEFPREKLHIMEQLGSGSFATVHRAEADGIIKKDIMSTVAVKMLRSTATDSDKSDFEKERKMYISLGYHPNVVTMLGYCTLQEPFFLIMEYLPNGNLQTYLRHIRTGSKEQYFDLKEEEKRNFLLPNEILSFASQIASGMEYLSSQSCIHRDLATRNILLGDDLIAKVSDFGLARDIQDSRQYEMKSKGRVPVRWMAPESLLDNIYTTKSDVWGFAVLMWELVTLGSHPYPGMSSRQVIDEIRGGYRLPKPESCSDEIYDVLKRCWNENPEERPSFSEICQIVDAMMADANGYLVMADLNRDDYLYLEPNKDTKSFGTADE